MHLNKILFSLLIMYCTSISGWSQQSVSDSLTVANFNSQAFKIYLSKPDSAIALSNKALALASKTNLKEGEAHSYLILSRAYWAKANYNLSAAFGFKALKFYENNYDTALWGKCLLDLGRTFCDLKNYKQGKVFIDQAAKLATTTGDEKLLAEVMREQSFLFIEIKEYDSAERSADSGIKLYEKAKDTLNASVLYGRKSRIYFNKGDYKKSEAYNSKSLLLDSLVKNRRALGVSYFMAAHILAQAKRYDEAITSLKNSIRISQELHNLTNIIRSHSLLADIYQAKHETGKAYFHLKTASSFKDSLYSMEKNAQIEEMKALYDMESKNKTIQLLENENQLEKQKTRNQNLLITFFSVAVVLLGVIIYVLWRMKQFQKKTNQQLALKNQDIESQNEEIRSQTDSLYEVNQLKSKLLSVISHDLRSPINNLQALLELVTEDHVTAAEFKELSIKLRGNLNVTQRALENLLNWSLSQMEGIQTQRIVFDINSVITEVIKLTEDTASKKQIILNTTSNTILSVEADINQIQLILRNLLHNAIKFSDQGGAIQVTAEKVNGLCKISIQDKGIGMTEEEVLRLLTTNEYFTKVGTQQEKGTGLGLLLCKDFITRNGGELFIESSTSTGTTVSFTIPLA